LCNVREYTIYTYTCPTPSSNSILTQGKINVINDKDIAAETGQGWGGRSYVNVNWLC